jgi:hypothetical protein
MVSASCALCRPNNGCHGPLGGYCGCTHCGRSSDAKTRILYDPNFSERGAIAGDGRSVRAHATATQRLRIRPPNRRAYPRATAGLIRVQRPGVSACNGRAYPRATAATAPPLPAALSKAPRKKDASVRAQLVVAS